MCPTLSSTGKPAGNHSTVLSSNERFVAYAEGLPPVKDCIAINYFAFLSSMYTAMMWVQTMIVSTAPCESSTLTSYRG